VCQRWRCYWCADAMGALSKPGVRCAPPQTWCVVLATLWWPARHMQAQRAMASRQRGARLVYWHDWASTLSGARRRGHATTTEKLWHASRGFSPRHHVWGNAQCYVEVKPQPRDNIGAGIGTAVINVWCTHRCWLTLDERWKRGGITERVPCISWRALAWFWISLGRIRIDERQP
jgi:hypothetical protein